jgi:phosphonoacetaldehyde dehydrogenase
MIAAATFAVYDPYTGEQVGEAPLQSERDIRQTLDAAAETRVELDRHGRSQVLEAVAARIAEAGDRLARLITRESGLALRDTRHELQRAVDVFRFAAAEALRDDGQVFAGDVSPNGHARRGYTLREPVSLVAAITPFNHPLNQVAHKLAPAMAAGAPIVLKPSEKTPLTALWLCEAVRDAGYPAEALAVVTGDRARILDAMLSHPAVALVCFTGSVAVGKHIASRLGYRRAMLELGGNDPLLVLRDADVDRAAELAVRGATANSGQRCTAVKRILVEEPVADALAERVAARIAALRAGNPLDEDTDVGTVIDEDAAIHVEARVEDAIDRGARLLAGGGRDGALLQPVALDHVPPGAPLVRQETFGPVAPIVRVRDLDHAIAVANGTAFGLSAGVVSNDLRAITRCIRELRCGTVNVDEVPGFRTELTPFGGVKDSGLGVKEGVLEAIKQMTTQKLYTLPFSA